MPDRIAKPPGAWCAAKSGARRLSGAARILAKTRSYGRAARGSPGGAKPAAVTQRMRAAEAVGGDVRARGHGRDRVDVAGDRRRRPDRDRRHREDAGAAADVGDAAGDAARAAPAGRAPSGSPGCWRGGRCRRPAPPRSRGRCGRAGPGRGRGCRGRRSGRPRPGSSSAWTCATQSRSSTRATAKSGAACSRARSARPAASGGPSKRPPTSQRPRAVVVVVDLARERRRVEPVERVAERAGGGLAGDGGGGAVERQGGLPDGPAAA